MDLIPSVLGDAASVVGGWTEGTVMTVPLGLFSLLISMKRNVNIPQNSTVFIFTDAMVASLQSSRF